MPPAALKKPPLTADQIELLRAWINGGAKYEPHWAYIPPQPVSSRQWHSGFLPGQFQGVPLYSTGDPVHYVGNPPGVDRSRQQDVITAVSELNRTRDAVERNPEIGTRIAQYELAFRMQMSVPELVDISAEPRHVLDMYGVSGPDGSFGYCLLARRLAERGVRFIHLYHRDWDFHDNLKDHMVELCASADRPTAALVSDLKPRGMLDETLIVWGGEFGRTPMAQGDVAWAAAQLSRVVAEHRAGNSQHILEPDLLRTAGALSQLELELSAYLGKGYDCKDSQFKFIGLPMYPCPVELKRLSSGFQYQVVRYLQLPRAVVLCMIHDYVNPPTHIDFIALSTLAEYLNS